MASEEQSNIQKDLNDLVKEYKSDLLEASEFIAILTSRTSDLANQSKILVKNNQSFGVLQKSVANDITKSFNVTKNLKDNYSSLRDINVDIEKLGKSQNSLKNTALGLERNIGKEGVKRVNDLIKLEKDREKQELAVGNTRNKLSKESIDKIDKAKEATLQLKSTQDNLNSAIQSMSQEEQDAFHEKIDIVDSLEAKQSQAQKEYVEALKSGNQADIDLKKEAFKNAQNLLSNYTSFHLSENDKILKSLMDQEKEQAKIANSAQAIFTPLEKQTLTEENKVLALKEQEKERRNQLSAEEELYAASLKTQDANEASLEGLKNQEKQIKNVENAQGIFNATLGSAKGILESIGAGGLASALGLDKAQEASKAMADKLTDGGKKSLGLFGKMRVAAAGFGAALKSALGPMAMISMLVDMFKAGEESISRASQASVDFAKNLGVSVEAGKKMYRTSSQIAGEIGALAEKVQENTAALQKQLGTTASLGKDTLKTYNQLVEKGGYSVETASEFTKISQLNGKTLKNNTAEMIGTIEAFKNQNGLALDTKGTMELIGKSSASVRLTLKNNVVELAKAASQAKKMGVEMSKLEDISNSLLNFEDSIAKEMEAELLIGRDINLEKARQFALEGKIGDAAAEISKQIGSAAEFQKMSVIQQQALAESVGMTKDELAGALTNQELLANTGFSSMDEAQQKLNKLLEEGKSIEEARLAIGNEVLAQQLDATSYAEKQELRQRSIQDSFAKVAQALMPVVEVFRELAVKLAPVIADLVTKILDVFKPILDLVIKIANRFGEFIGKIASTLMPILEALSTALTPLLDIITVIIFKVADHMMGAFETIMDILSGPLTKIIGVIADLFNGPVMDAITNIISIAGDFIAKLSGPLTAVITTIVDLFSGPVMDAITTIVSIIGNLITSLSGPLTQIIGVIADLFSGPIMNAIITIVSTIGSLIEKLSGPLTTVIETIANIFSGPIMNAITAIVTTIGNLITSLSGPLTQIIGVIADLFSGPIIDAITDIIEVIGNVIQQLSGPLSTIINTIASIFSGPVIDAITTIISIIGNLISDLSGPLSTVINTIASIFSGPVMGAITTIVSTIGSLIEKLSGPLTTVIETVAGIFSGPVMDAITTIVTTIGNLITSLSGPLSKVIESVASIFSGPLMDSIIRIVEVIGDVIQQLSGPLSTVIQVVANIFTKLVEALIPIIPTLLEVTTMFINIAIDMLPPILNLVADLVENLLPLIIPPIVLFAEVLESLMPLLDPFIVLLTDVLVPLLNTIVALFQGDISGAISNLGLVFEGVITYVSTLWTSYVETFKGLFNSVGTYLTSMFTNVWNTIKSIFSGIGDLIGGVIKAPINLVIQGANTVLEGINTISFDVPDIFGGGKIGFDLSPIPLIQDGSSVSKKGPFTITDNQGNTAVTHPNDQLVVSPNVSYISDAVTTKKSQQVFPVSEKFGALDVKVSPKRVSVQKISDGATGGSKSTIVQELSNVFTSFYQNLNSLFTKVSDVFKAAIPALTNAFSSLLQSLDLSFKSISAEFKTISSAISSLTKSIDYIVPAFQNIPNLFTNFINSLTKIFSNLISAFKTFTETQVTLEASKDLKNPLFEKLFKKLDITTISDGTTVSNNGPFTISDKFGNMAITHPKDKLVVSPNISYINDGAIPSPQNKVFPVSEKFGALDVKVSPKGVSVQKVKDALTTKNTLIKESSIAQKVKDALITKDTLVKESSIAQNVKDALVTKETSSTAQNVKNNTSSYLTSELKTFQHVSDGSSSSKGPFTITDRFGNVAVTHPKDGIVVSPNISYVNDGVTSEKGPVFPVSEKFGALDVKVSPKGVLVQKVEDSFIGGIMEKTALLYDPIGYIKEKLTPVIMEELVPLIQHLFKKGSILNKAFKNLAKKIPYIGPLMDIGGGVLDINKVLSSGQSRNQINTDIGNIAFGALGSIGGATLGGIAGSALGPIGTFVGSFAGGELGGFVSEYLSKYLGGPNLGNLIVNNIPQLAEGGVVSKPTVALIGEAGPEAVVPLDQIAQESPQTSTTIIESDNSDLKKELQEMKQLMAGLISQIPSIANRPITVELNGNKVGQALGQNAYRL